MRKTNSRAIRVGANDGGQKIGGVIREAPRFGAQNFLPLMWTYPDGARQLAASRPFECVPPRTHEEFEFLDLVDFGSVAFAVETVL